MAYDADFYTAYQAYLEEETVRSTHDRMFDVFAAQFLASCPDGTDSLVADLGCGQSQEWRKFGWGRYVGFDVNAKPDSQTFVDDYRSESFVARLKEFSPAAFVSLFSVEITSDFRNNQHFYDLLFDEIPSLQVALVSGFYYTDMKHKNPVREAGDLVSFQTLEPVENGASTVLKEMRVLEEVPSLLFGNKVVEVWRFFTRRACSTVEPVMGKVYRNESTVEGKEFWKLSSRAQEASQWPAWKRAGINVPDGEA